MSTNPNNNLTNASNIPGINIGSSNSSNLMMLNSHLPSMQNPNTSSGMGNILNLSPSRLEDKSKSATNKAYMIGQNT
jgi:hypothetical protein